MDLLSATILGVGLLLSSGMAVHIVRLRRRLADSTTQARQTENSLRTLSVAVEQSPVSVVITGLDAAISYVNPQFTAITGYTLDEVVGQNPSVLQSGLTDQKVFEEMWEQLARGQAWTGEFVNRRKNGEIFYEEAHIAPVQDIAGNTVQYVAVKLDITERKQAEERLAHLAHHDALTNLPNRPLFHDRMQQALALARRDRQRLALLYLDLDNFKPVNDTFGHAVGDQLLQEAAKRICACVRASDTVGRIGGDEFVVLLPGVEAVASGLQVAEKIRQTLRRPFVLAGQSLQISCSIGIALYPDHGSTELELSHHADLAMYHAKESGRNCLRIFQREMSEAPMADGTSKPTVPDAVSGVP
jgi:diguanylate cyclase (GGDEF)-like protein/PAS domain S-box-containing protein